MGPSPGVPKDRGRVGKVAVQCPQCLRVRVGAGVPWSQSPRPFPTAGEDPVSSWKAHFCLLLLALLSLHCVQPALLCNGRWHPGHKQEKDKGTAICSNFPPWLNVPAAFGRETGLGPGLELKWIGTWEPPCCTGLGPHPLVWSWLLEGTSLPCLVSLLRNGDGSRWSHLHCVKTGGTPKSLLEHTARSPRIPRKVDPLPQAPPSLASLSAVYVGASTKMRVDGRHGLGRVDWERGILLSGLLPWQWASLGMTLGSISLGHTFLTLLSLYPGLVLRPFLEDTCRVVCVEGRVAQTSEYWAYSNLFCRVNSSPTSHSPCLELILTS